MKKTLLIIICILLFTVGYFTSDITAFLNKEQPLTFNTNEKPSPYDWIKEDQIQLYQDRIVIKINNPSLAAYINTNSMDPLLDETSNGIEITPKSPNDIHIGDIISYTPTWTDGIVVHRVIEIGQDNEGWYAIAKGDNATIKDPKIRFNQIKYITIGVIY